MADIDAACVAAGSGGWSQAIFEATMRQPDSTVLVATSGPAGAVRHTSNAAAGSGFPDPSAAAAEEVSIAATGLSAGPISVVSASNPTDFGNTS